MDPLSITTEKERRQIRKALALINLSLAQYKLIKPFYLSRTVNTSQLKRINVSFKPLLLNITRKTNYDIYFLYSEEEDAYTIHFVS